VRGGAAILTLQIRDVEGRKRAFYGTIFDVFEPKEPVFSAKNPVSGTTFDHF
jgi:hypothetical protein